MGYGEGNWTGIGGDVACAADARLKRHTVSRVSSIEKKIAVNALDYFEPGPKFLLLMKCMAFLVNDMMAFLFYLTALRKKQIMTSSLSRGILIESSAPQTF